VEISIETRDEFNRLCNKIVNKSMLRIKKEDEELVSRLMCICFDAGYMLAIKGKAEIEL